MPIDPAAPPFPPPESLTRFFRLDPRTRVPWPRWPIQPETVNALRDDRAFLQAFHYPVVD